MWIWTWSSLTFRSWASSDSYAFRRAFGLFRRALALRRTHSSSWSMVRWRRALLTGLLLEALALLLEPAGVVALVGDAAAAVELEDPAGDVVEEVAIVGDGHDRPLVVAQMALEPRHRLGVEVVGGLVEQEQVGLGEEQAGEGDAPLLAAGEVLDGCIGRGRAQRVHGDLERGVEVPAVGGVDLLLHAGELVRSLLGVVHRELVEAVEQVLDLGDAVLDVAADVLGRGRGGAPARAGRRWRRARAAPGRRTRCHGRP